MGNKKSFSEDELWSIFYKDIFHEIDLDKVFRNYINCACWENLLDDYSLNEEEGYN